jgi:DHA1 family inner membrane transport protein
VLLTLLAGAIGFGGMFAMYTYIAPTVTEVAGLSEALVPLYLLAFGIGMVVGTPLGGRLADWSVFRSMLIGSVLMGLTLVAFTVTSQWFLTGLVTVFVLSVVSSILVVALQMRLMQVAGDAQTIGAAMNHASLNVANALGAWLGGVVVAAGFGYTSTAWVGAGLSFAGLLVLLASANLHRRTVRVDAA